MLKQPQDPKERLHLYQAMRVIKQTRDGQILIKYLKSELQRLQDKNDNEKDEMIMRRIQGANSYGKKLLSMMEISNEEIEKLRR